MTPMNSRVIAVAMLAAAGSLAACDHKPGTRTALAPDPSAQVIGVQPAAPSASEPPGVTPVTAQTTEVSKAVESTSMPLPGQPNDHSNVAPLPSEDARTKEVLKSPEAAKQANNGTEERSGK